MKFPILVSLVLAGSLRLAAQDNKSFDDWVKVLSYGVGNQTKQTELSSEEVAARAKQCFPEYFVNSQLVLGNNAQFDNIPIQYDYKEQILLVQNKEKYLIAAPNMIKEITFNDRNKSYKLINVAQFGRTYGRKGFFEILQEQGTNKLVCHRSIEVIGPSYNASMDSGIKDTTYVEKKEFLIFQDQKSYLLNNFKSKTLSQFDDLETPLKNYVKKEKLKFKEEEDLIKFALYFWAL